MNEWVKKKCLYGGSDGKEPTFNARDLGLIPGSGRSSVKGMATHSSILAWRIPWTEGYSPWGHKELEIYICK